MNLSIIPGKSLGDVKIGDSVDTVKQLGFAIDTSLEAPNTIYLRRSNLIVIAVNEKVVEISAEQAAFKTLKYKGKSLPLKYNIESFKKFFKTCEVINGSGGKLLYCDDKGIQIAGDHKDMLISLSVILRR